MRDPSNIRRSGSPELSLLWVILAISYLARPQAVIAPPPWYRGLDDRCAGGKFGGSFRPACGRPGLRPRVVGRMSLLGGLAVLCRLYAADCGLRAYGVVLSADAPAWIRAAHHARGAQRTSRLATDIERYTRTSPGMERVLRGSACRGTGAGPVLPLESWSRWCRIGVVVPATLFLVNMSIVAIACAIIVMDRSCIDPQYIAVVREAAVKAAPAIQAAPAISGDTDHAAACKIRTPDDPCCFIPVENHRSAFFAQVHRLAEALPDAPFVVNLCETRHGFMLGFAAALLRGQTSLLPSGQGRGDWQQVLRQFPDAWLLSEKPLTADRVFDIGQFLASSATHAVQTPLIDGGQRPRSCLLPAAPVSRLHTQDLGTALPWRHQSGRCPELEETPSLRRGSVPPQHMFALRRR